MSRYAGLIPEQGEAPTQGRADSDDVDVELVESSDEKIIAPDGYRLTDRGNAQRLIERHGHEILFVPTWGTWLVYSGGRWRTDHAETLVAHLAGQLGTVLLSNRNLNAARRNEKMIRALIRHAKKSENSSGVLGTLAATATVPGVAIDHEVLDADPWLFNVRNGTVDLRNGTLRPHDANDRISMQAAVAFDSTAPAADFELFLEQILPDNEVRGFVQRLLGLALVGEQVEHVLPIALGGGANGKSTLTRIVAAVLGEYAVVASKDLLLALKHDTHPTTKASLFRKRFAHSGELPHGAKLDEAQVKELTGGDRVKARRMRQDEWEFEPSHTLWLHANHRPMIEGTDDGIWRRVLLIPFDVQVPEADRDPKLAGRIITNESAGVLRWMVEGLGGYLANGLAVPTKVRAATNTYRTQSDSVATFIDECGVQFGPAETITGNELMRLHCEWFSDAGVSEKEGAHYQRVVEECRRRGADKRRARSRGGVYWTGIGAANA